MKIFHIVRAISILPNVSFACGAKCFDSIALALLHFDIWVIFDAGYSFATMNLIWLNRVAIQIANYFDWVDFSLYLYFIGLHGLLNVAANLSDPHVDTCLLDSCICSIFHCLK